MLNASDGLSNDASVSFVPLVTLYTPLTVSSDGQGVVTQRTPLSIVAVNARPFMPPRVCAASFVNVIEWIVPLSDVHVP